MQLHASAQTAGIDIVGLLPGLWSVPRATATPASIIRRAGA
jgi:hypothetical protein